MYQELFAEHHSEHPYSTPQPPASASQIAGAEAAMGVPFPAELRKLLAEMNGDNWLCLSCDQIVSCNNLVREGLSEVYDGLYDLLFVAGNGCGDYYGYAIRDGACQEGQLLMWEHETNETHIVAASLAELIRRYFLDEI